MTETFFIGDTHFSHANILKFEDTAPYRKFATIEEHDEELIKRWNSVVTPKDKVYHLGDFAWTEKAIEIGAMLHGDKVLILGNHDHFQTKKYLRYFRKVCGAVGIGHDFIMTHIPVHESQFHRWKCNVHGHLHSNNIGLRIHNPETGYWEEGNDPRYINVSAEQINLTPISYEDLKKRMPL